MSDNVNIMADNTVFQKKLAEALESYNSWLLSSELPQLHDLFRIQQTAVESIHGLLLKKGVLREDPYKYDNKVSEIVAPDTAPYAESEHRKIIGIRLSEYNMMLDFLNNSYQFSPEFLDIERVSRIMELLKSFNWKEITSNSNSPNSRGLAEVVSAAKSGTDSLSSNILSENIARIAKDMVAIQSILSNLTLYHRENCKYLWREKCSDVIYASYDDKAAFVRAVKKASAATFSKKLFYPELAEELYAELNAPNADKIQSELLEKLSKSEKKVIEKTVTVDMKSMLLDAVRVLGGLSLQLEEVIRKTEENHKSFDNQYSSFWSKFKKMLMKSFGIKEKPLILDVESKDLSNQRIMRYSIEYQAFIDDLRRRTRLYAAFTSKTTGAYQKIEQSSEPQILRLLSQHIEEMQVILKKLQGVDAYYKSKSTPSSSDKTYGLKVEIATMKNTLINANQKRFEYSNLIEEQQQLAKLGIQKGV